jgi:glycosyltransferase involved in cell wall biosynthesis
MPYNRAQPLSLALARRGCRVFYINPVEQWWSVESLGAQLLAVLAPGNRARISVQPGSHPNLSIVSVASTHSRSRKFFTADFSPAVQEVLERYLRRLRRRSHRLILVASRQIRRSIMDAVAWNQIILDIEDPWFERPWGTHPFAKVVITQALDRADRLLANGERIAEEFRKETDKSIAILPNGVEASLIARLDPSAPVPQGLRAGDGNFRVLFTGTIDSRIHFGVLARVFPKLAEIDFYFIGDAVIPEDHQENWETLMTAGNCYHIPQVPYAELPTYLVHADGFILPYAEDGGTRMFPAKLLEYIAAARPVLSTQLHPEVEAVRAAISVYRDEESLERALRVAETASFKLSPQVAESCRLFVRQNTWDRRAETLCQLWSDS